MSKASIADRRIWCVVPAAGSGSRFGGEKPKQYMDLGDKSLIVTTLERLLRHPQVAGVVVALAAEDRWWPGLSELGGKPVRTTLGGATRAESVLAALRALPADVGPEDWVAVHDAARPGIRLAELQRLVSFCLETGLPAILAVRASDTLKRVDAGGRIAGTVDRENIWRAQTPQCAPRALLTDALELTLERARKGAGAIATDEAKALEEFGVSVCIVEGHESNLKVTTGPDLQLARFWLELENSVLFAN